MKASLVAGLTCTRRIVVDAARTIDFMGEERRGYFHIPLAPAPASTDNPQEYPHRLSAVPPLTLAPVPRETLATAPRRAACSRPVPDCRDDAWAGVDLGRR